MPTTPEQIRRGLQLVTTTAVEAVQAVVEQTPPAARRTALFTAAPLIVGTYTQGSAALALDWYEELRDLSEPTSTFTPTLVAPVRNELIANAVAWATEVPEKTLLRLLPTVQKEVATGFWATTTQNVKNDPDAVGWQRFTRGPDACPFCRMLADKGAVYRKDTATFAAHTTCHCVAAAAFKNHHGPEADVMQYAASSKRRSDKDKARLRDYIKEHYAD